MKRNPHLATLAQSYLFTQIQARVQKFRANNPQAALISLGIGDTTEPLTPTVTGALVAAAAQLGTEEGYSGYGPEQGMQKLREKIVGTIYNNCVKGDEVFISDGAKCDLGRLQTLFGSAVTIAVQDPTYPVYVDGSLIQGVAKIVPMPCTPDNDFFPCLDALPPVDLIYFCSPNNPTGAVATRAQLEKLVAFAHKHRSIIIFDSAYAHFISDPTLPSSIFEIEGAKEVAIEVGSFSKRAGFSGVRLGWTVVPQELCYDNGASVHADWHRLTSTLFNGASIISQHGALAALENTHTPFYLENAHLLKTALQNTYEVFGGKNAPYLWLRCPGNSWDTFEHFLSHYHLITTPGSGFGPHGEGFLRLTAFAKRHHVLEAVSRLQTVGVMPE